MMPLPQLQEAVRALRHPQVRRRRKWRCSFIFPLSLSLCPPSLSVNFVISVTEEQGDDMEVEMVTQPR